MDGIAIVVIAGIALMSSLGFSEQDLKESPPSLAISRNATVGDVYTGVIVRETKKELILDTTPCNAGTDKKYVSYVPPYTKKPGIATRECEKKFALVQVTKNR